MLTATQVGACAVAGVGLRRRLVPAWRGPWATLAAAVAGLAVLVGVGQLLGTVGLLRQWALPAALVAVAWALRPSRRASPAVPDDGPVPAAPGPATTPAADAEAAHAAGSPALEAATPARSQVVRIAALLATAAVAASWVERVVAVFRRGQTDGDSMMYHLVFAARFVQRGWTTGAEPVGPDAWVAFYPANVELIEATLILPFGTDVLVPFMNLAWLAMALAAAWCIGAEAGRGPLGLVVGALVCSVPVLVATQAGTARVDIAICALALSTVALLLHQPRSVGSCALAGLALGLGIGSKFGLLPLAGVLLVGVAFVLVRREGARTALAWSGATAVAGTYWYVRNWAIAGSPVPAVDLRLFGVGFAPLPEDRRALLEGSSIVDHLDRSGFWSHIGRPVAEQAFGAPLIGAGVAAAVLAVIVWVLRERPIGVRHAVAVAGIAGCIAYPFSPYSAPLLDASVTSPFATLIVAFNVRYLLPALALILCLLPLALDRFRRVADVVAVATALAVVFLWVDNMRFDAEWPTTAGDSALGAGVVGLVAGTALLAGAAVRRVDGARRSSPLALGPVAACLLAAMTVTGLVAADRTGVHRHDELPRDVVDLWQATDDAPGQEIALLDDWVQYPLMGASLERDVAYVGLPRHRGLTEPPRTCDELDAVLAADRYDLVVVQRPIVTAAGVSNLVACLRDRATADAVLENSAGAVFRLR